MRYGKTLMCIATLLAVAACDDDGITGPRDFGPAASIRFVNLNRDTGTVDFRFVDRVENLPTLLGVPYAGYSGMFQRTHAGARPTRVFPTSTSPTLTQIRLVDTSVNLAQNTRYTFVYAGRANGGQDELAMIEEGAPPTPPAGNIALRVLHGAFGTGSVDVYVVPVDSVSQATPVNFQTIAVHQFANVSYLSPTTYVNVPVRPTTGARFYRFVVTDPGGNTALFAVTPNQPGAPAAGSYGAQPGVQIAGSVLTAVVTPGTVPQTRQSTTANQARSVFLMIDKTLDP